ncbi:futalosine synthase [Planifilum fimeticola]|uniref:Chorismate dehydratase n=1 Tax=Planifilum fimeticola TaxID=201975 RepID=A0A2T0LDF2_9BACL|nr:menaquinone biosynthesis protein [Planifilum fimeticola]PRX40078.1 futalosine synthase [Planifilum fimeticola]
MRPIRIGRIAFTNILPIYHFFDPAGLNVELIHQVPSQLNRRMAAGEIDMGPISSFAYGENHSRYSLIPHLSVSSRGPVRSIYLFTRQADLSDLRSARIAVTNTSATSVALLKILLQYFEGGDPEYLTMPPSLEEMMDRADAALLIGDDAVRGAWQNPGYRVLDLGEEWYKRTGLDMTFAVWAVRDEVIERLRDEVSAIASRLIGSKEKGLKDLFPVVEEARRRLGGSPEFWFQYYTGLCYDLGERQLEGLKAYYQYAGELGLLPENVRIRVLDLPAGTPC